MQNRMFHVFRNTPSGRETLMQAAYFCQRYFGMSLAVMIPTDPRFLMRFESGEVMVSLDAQYMQSPGTAADHVKEIMPQFKVRYSLYKPVTFAEPGVACIPVDWAVMSCPRVISEQSSRIGLGHIGPKVRGIAKHAPFPLFIPALNYKPWENVSVFFGGSQLGVLAVREGIAVARLARAPFRLFTQINGTTYEECEEALVKANLLSEVQAEDGSWELFKGGTLEENVYAVPHDSLVVVGAAGHRLMTELIFGSKLEIIQATLPNPLMVIGPNCRLGADLNPDS